MFVVFSVTAVIILTDAPMCPFLSNESTFKLFSDFLGQSY